MYTLLDNDLDRAGAFEFDTEDEAIKAAFARIDSAVSPCYIEDSKGDFVALVYCGVVWRSDDEATERCF